MRVLVIDDEPDVLLLCRVNLEHTGHEVLGASDAEEGMELAVSQRPDLILLDLMLPSRDGLSVLSELRERPETSETPVVVLSAKVRLDDQIRGWEAGCVEYITKPFSPIALAEVVERVCRMTPEQRRVRRDEALATLAATV